MSRLVKIFTVFISLEVYIEAGTPQWSYGPKTCNLIAKPCGFDHWDVLNAACKQVGTQSPIDATIGEGFTLAEDITVDDLKVVRGAESCKKANFIVNQHTSLVALPDCQDTFNANQIIFKGKPYILEQFHWRSPSEHTVDGTRYPMEAQFLHRNAVDKSQLVVVVFINVAPEETLAGKWVADLLKQMPWWQTNPPIAIQSETMKEVPVEWGEGRFSPYDFIPSMKGSYFTYTGSSTTPGCDLGVEWIMAPTVQSVTQATLNLYRNGINQVPQSDSQLALFSDIFPGAITPDWHKNAWVTPGGTSSSSSSSFGSSSMSRRLVTSKGLPTDIEWKSALGVNVRPVQPLSGPDGIRKFYKVTNHKDYSNGKSSGSSSESSASKALVVVFGALLALCCLAVCSAIGYWFANKQYQAEERRKNRLYGGMADVEMEETEDDYDVQ